MTRLVIDANVAIKWVLPEVYSDLALSILDNDQDELLVPDFFFAEITNILWKRIQRKELSLEKAQENLEDIKQIDFKVFDSYDLAAQALEIAVQVNQAIYDCIYLSLAINHDCRMITADERSINAMQQNLNTDSVVWLGSVGDRGV